MEDILACPICGSKNKMHSPTKVAMLGLTNESIWQRTCHGTNHIVQTYVNDKSEVVAIKVSLDYKYSKVVMVDYIHNTSRISCYKLGSPIHIDVPKAITLDFPDLIQAKKQVNLYVTFS